jgi:hypothetical protein
MNKDIESLISFCEGKIKSLSTARQPMPFQKFDQNQCDGLTRKIHRFKEIIALLRELEERRNQTQ